MRITGRRVIIVFILTLCIILVSFVAIDNIIEKYLINKYPLRRIFNFYLTNREKNLVLLVGSSQVREGLDAKLMQSRLKSYNVYNLGFTGDTPSRRLLDLPYILKLKPKLVVFGIDYFQVSGNYKVAADDVKMIVDLLDPQDTRRVEDFYEEDVRQVLRWSPWQELGYRTTYVGPAFDYAIHKSRYAKKEAFYDLKQPFDYSGTLDAAVKNKILKEVFDTRFVLAEQNNRDKAALIFILDSLRQHGIPVIVADMPDNPTLLSNISDTSKKIYADYIDTEIIKRCDAYINYKTKYGDADFYDMTHMNKIGRDALTKDIADQITKRVR